MIRLLWKDSLLIHKNKFLNLKICNTKIKVYFFQVFSFRSIFSLSQYFRKSDLYVCDLDNIFLNLIIFIYFMSTSVAVVKILFSNICVSGFFFWTFQIWRMRRWSQYMKLPFFNILKTSGRSCFNIYVVFCDHGRSVFNVICFIIPGSQLFIFAL